jgi:DNA-binding protein H-NS
MRRWEYKKLALNEAPRRGDEIDLLCDAGDEGWELVAVLPNGVAYLKREVDEHGADEKPAAGDESVAVAHREEANAVGHEVKPKFRDPATGETWSGRGRMATWLKRKQDAGEDIDKYLV